MILLKATAKDTCCLLLTSDKEHQRKTTSQKYARFEKLLVVKCLQSPSTLFIKLVVQIYNNQDISDEH